MWRSFFKDKKWHLWSYGGGFFIISLLVLQTYLDVLFNSWYKDFYDILQTAEDRDISEFWSSIKRFLYIFFQFKINYLQGNVSSRIFVRFLS